MHKHVCVLGVVESRRSRRGRLGGQGSLGPTSEESERRRVFCTVALALCRSGKAGEGPSWLSRRCLEGGFG